LSRPVPPTFHYMTIRLPQPGSFSDYRQFLRAYYEDKRKSSRFFSYRYMARRLGVDHAYVLRILRGKAHLADRHIGGFAVICHLDRNDAEIFRTLVRATKTKDGEEAAGLRAKLASIGGADEPAYRVCGGKEAYG
jgi:uncharacterized protein (TIGR02147 family)